VTKWTDDGRIAEWVTESESEFDLSERDSWYAKLEYDLAICPSCSNFRAICSSPGGLDGDGYNIRQDVCYATAAREATLRRIQRKYERTQPDLQGGLPTDGVSIAVTLQPDDSEDLLGLGERSEIERLLTEQPPREERQSGEQAHDGASQ
jgi:hypothetical protein